MAKRTKSRLWTYSVGPYRHRIALYESKPSEGQDHGIIYARMRDAERPGKYREISLHTRNREEAILWGHEELGRWLAGEKSGREQRPTVARVLDLYIKNHTITKVESEQDADTRRVDMWMRVLGPSSDLSRLSAQDWQSFTTLRRSGAIDSRGEKIDAYERMEVRAGTVAADLTFLLSVMSWATKWRVDGQYLMRENPARGYPIPSEKNPRRPFVTDTRFDSVRAKAAEVSMVVGFGKKKRSLPSYLPELMDLAIGSGRRISAILALRYSDLKLNDGGPLGSILWPAETDKTGKSWLVPMSPQVRGAIERVLSERPGIGAAYLFPAVNDPSRPVAVEVASAWLLKAEGLAEVEKQEGSLWHAYRRAFATARKHLPVVDVAAAGGWSDKNTVLSIYQQPDPQTLYRVVSEPAKLLERASQG